MQVVNPLSYIVFDQVCKDYPAGDTVVHAADHVSFEIEQGEFCVVLGPSGAGKTTVLNLLGGMDKGLPAAGSPWAARKLRVCDLLN